MKKKSVLYLDCKALFPCLPRDRASIGPLKIEMINHGGI